MAIVIWPSIQAFRRRVRWRGTVPRSGGAGCRWQGARLSLPTPARAQGRRRNNLAEGSANNCSPGCSPSAGCAAAVAVAVAAALMNNAADKESRVCIRWATSFQPPTTTHEFYHNRRTWDVPHHQPPPPALLDLTLNRSAEDRLSPPLPRALPALLHPQA
jgi:hypothetical protein